LRQEAPVIWRLLLGAASVGVVLLVWMLVTRGGPTDAMISPSNLPSPKAVFVSYEKTGYLDERDAETGRPKTKQIVYKAIPELLKQDVGRHIFATLKRVLMGMLWASLFGIGVGVMAGSYKAVGAFFNPLLIFLRSVPMGALLPLTLILFGITEGQKEKFIFLAVVPFVFSDTIKAISAVPQRYVETAETLGASRFQIIRKVLFPLALPDIITSLRFQFGLALGYIMLAEALNTNEGIGALLNAGDRFGLVQQKYLLLFIIAILAFALDAGIKFFQRGIFHYRRDL